MPTVVEAIDAAIREVTNARSLISRYRGKQIRGVDQLAALRSTAYAWFNSHRPQLNAELSSAGSAVDSHLSSILKSTDKNAAKQTYLGLLKDAKNALVELRSSALTQTSVTATANTDDLAPDFSPLAGNVEMRDILTRRWHECHKCVQAGAHLAAIVMMGGLLEALFVARANKMTDKSTLIGATTAPKDKTTGKTLNYQDWMLDSYIKVGHELKWISDSAKDIADVLKEYRNYIHPEKERRHGVVLAFNDSAMFWQVTKGIVRQLLLSTTTT